MWAGDRRWVLPLPPPWGFPQAAVILDKVSTCSSSSVPILTYQVLFFIISNKLYYYLLILILFLGIDKSI